MRTIVQIRGVCDYLDGTIVRPSSPTTEFKRLTTITETSWNSKNLSLDEWKTQDI